MIFKQKLPHCPRCPQELDGLGPGLLLPLKDLAAPVDRHHERGPSKSIGQGSGENAGLLKHQFPQKRDLGHLGLGLSMSLCFHTLRYPLPLSSSFPRPGAPPVFPSSFLPRLHGGLGALADELQVRGVDGELIPEPSTPSDERSDTEPPDATRRALLGAEGRSWSTPAAEERSDIEALKRVDAS